MKREVCRERQMWGRSKRVVQLFSSQEVRRPASPQSKGCGPMQVLASSEEEAAQRVQQGAEELRVVVSSEPEQETRIGEVRRLRPI